MPQAKQYISKLDVQFSELAFLKNIVDRAKQRITASILFELSADKPSRNVDVEITSFPIAILIVTSVNDNILTKRNALFEAKKMCNYLQNENDEVIFEIAKSFNWWKKDSSLKDMLWVRDQRARGAGAELSISYKAYGIGFADFLRNATSFHDSHWKLVNHQLLKGQVEVTKREMCRLLEEEIREYIENRVVGEVPQIPQTIQDSIDEIKTEYLKIKPSVTEFDKMRVLAEEHEYPPCIQSLYDRTIKGQHLSHIERFTLVAYLLHQGIGEDAITNLFSSVSDYRRGLTRYQVEHLAGKRGSRTVYNPPNCATLRTHGVCVNPDAICKTIKNPLIYHLRKKAHIFV